MKNNLKINCPVCNYPLIKMGHWEVDGIDGSYEPNWECVNGCDQEVIDTGTNYGYVIPQEDIESMVL